MNINEMLSVFFIVFTKSFAYRRFTKQAWILTASIYGYFLHLSKSPYFMHKATKSVPYATFPLYNNAYYYLNKTSPGME
jgi:hypothetical protein